MKWLILLVAAATASGCASSTRPQSFPDRARPVPAARMLSPQWSKPLPRTVALAIEQGHSTMPRFCGSRISIDGVEIATLAAGERLDLHLPFGAHALAARSVPLHAISVCVGGLADALIHLDPGVPQRYRLSRLAEGELYFHPGDFL